MSLTRFASPTMNVTNSERVLKNYCKAKGYEKPVYRIISRNSTLLDGRVYRFKHYVCVVSVNGFQLAEDNGFSKRIARKKAAMMGLQQLRVYELQNFWQVYRTILPQGLLKDVVDVVTDNARGPRLIGEKKLMITASAVTIEELIPTEGVMTPQSVFSGKVRLPTEELTKPQYRERSDSTDSSNLLINAAIEKLKNYKDNVDGSWEQKEKEEKSGEQKKISEFSEEDLGLFNEKPEHHQSTGNAIQDIINEVTHEIETIEEKGQDDLGL